MLEEIHKFDTDEIKIVMQELVSELSTSDSPTMNDESNGKDKSNPYANPGIERRTLNPPLALKSSSRKAFANPLDNRVEALERRLAQLEKAILTWVNSST